MPSARAGGEAAEHGDGLSKTAQVETSCDMSRCGSPDQLTPIAALHVFA